MPNTIVILEDNAERISAMRTCLGTSFPTVEMRFFAEAAEMIRFLDAGLSDALVISLDHDLDSKTDAAGNILDPGTGRDVAEYLAQRTPVCSIILHTSNSEAAVGMKLLLREAGWKTRRVAPFDDLTWVELDWLPTIRRALGVESRRSRLSERQRQELERRVADDEANPEDVMTWEQFKAETLARLHDPRRREGDPGA